MKPLSPSRHRDKSIRLPYSNTSLALSHSLLSLDRINPASGPHNTIHAGISKIEAISFTRNFSLNANRESLHIFSTNHKLAMPLPRVNPRVRMHPMQEAPDTRFYFWSEARQ